MERIVSYLQESGFPLSHVDALEVFAREGDWVAIKYASVVKSIEAWELNPIYLPQLRANIPHATIQNVDSIIHLAEVRNKYGLISIDNPQGIYGNNYCEHFNVLEQIPRIITKTAAVVFVLNHHPYDRRLYQSIKERDNYGMEGDVIEQWFKRREQFYGVDARELSLEFVSAFYNEYFKKRGVKVQDCKFFALPSKIPDYPSFLSRCLVILSAESSE